MIPAQRVFGLTGKRDEGEADIIGAVTVDPTRSFLASDLMSTALVTNWTLNSTVLVEFLAQLAVLPSGWPLRA